MKSIFKFLFTFLTIFLLFSSCAEKRDPFSVTSHPEGWNNQESSDFHGLTILTNNGNSNNCKSCHGLDYEGGSSGISCTSAGCHNNHEGPEACNTCHGNELNAAPPEDIFGNIDETVVGVGLHQSHLLDTTWTYQKDCSMCHIVPDHVNSPGHFDNYPFQAELNFNSLANQNGKLNATWNHDSATCENIYCHGAFVFDSLDAGLNSWVYTENSIRGNNPTLQWTSVNPVQIQCGSCHGLPPTGHSPLTNCVSCHPKVVDANLNIIDKNLHINGKKEVF